MVRDMELMLFIRTGKLVYSREMEGGEYGLMFSCSWRRERSAEKNMRGGVGECSEEREEERIGRGLYAIFRGRGEVV